MTADSGERMDFDGALDFLEQRSGLGSVMGLDSIRNLLRELSDPQKDLEFVHIAGTNGKGSVSACLSSILKEAGYRTGTYTSPAVISVRERYQVDGSWITEREFALLADRVKAAAGRMEEKGRGIPTVFEIETAMAFLYFKEKAAGWWCWKQAGRGTGCHQCGGEYPGGCFYFHQHGPYGCAGKYPGPNCCL